MQLLYLCQSLKKLWWSFETESQVVRIRFGTTIFKLLSIRLFYSFKITWNPPESSKSSDHWWFSYLHKEGHRFPEFLCVCGTAGIVSAACTTGITIQREVRESSDRPHFPSQTYSTFTCPLLLLLLATTHYSPSSLDIVTQLCPASITEDSSTVKTHHLCFGFIQEMMVISTPASDSCYDILSWKTVR